RGSTGVDLAATETIVLTDSSVSLVPTGVFGPLGKGKSVLLLGRSSATLQGLFVLPGLIDSDYTGESKIMVWTPTPPCSVPGGTPIAQLVYFDACPPAASHPARGAAGFGSTGVPQIFWAQPVAASRPTLTGKLSLNQHGCIQLDSIIDTGADVTVIS
ncbi:POK9 protein, partial [Chionis minor]|nr:POK9 protein [Chionis minor]